MRILKNIVFIAVAIISLITSPVLASSSNDPLPDRLVILKYEISREKLNIEVRKSSIKINKSIAVDFKIIDDNMANAINLLNKNDPDIKDIIKLRELLEKMYRIFLSPVEETLSTNDIICLIPGKRFADFPFHVFIKDGRYLLEDYLISYAAETAQIYNLIPGQTIKHTDLRDLDVTAYSDELGIQIMKSLNILYIPSISEEAPLKKLEYVLRNSVTLYIATHGEFDTMHNTYRLLFDAKYINIYKQFRIRYRSELTDIQNLTGAGYKMKFLFVNACESASHMFFPEKAYQMGIDTFIGSMWSHPSTDRASANVVRRFYSNWKNGMSKVEALILAQRETLYKEREANRDNDHYRKNGDYPHFWAQFVLFGDWR